MTVFNDTYDTLTPDGDTDDPSEADDRMREIKAANQERNDVDHVWDLTGSEVSDADTGEHRKITLHEPIAKPTAVANKGFVYGKDVGGKIELYYLDEDDNEMQITTGGKLNGALLLNDSVTKAALEGTLPDGAALDAATETGDGDRTIVDLAYAKTGDTVQHDAEGGYSNCDVDGTKTKVYTKYLIGTLDADASTAVAHGITDIDKILHVSVMVHNSGGFYKVKEMGASASATQKYEMEYDGTNVTINNVGTPFQGEKYRIKIDYIL